MRSVLTMLAITAVCHAQTTMNMLPLAFDVVSVKPNLAGGSGTRMEHGSFRATNVTARRLIRSAFGVMDHQILQGPGWIDDDRFDVLARIDTQRDLTAEE